MVKSGWQYYVYVFQHRGFVGGVLGFFAFAILISSFDTTLPLHVRDVFGWDSMPTGLMFLALQGPSIALSPFIGWLKDRVGTRIPTTVGFSILAPLMWLLGVPGDERFPWANQGQRGQVIYAVDVTAVGIVSCLLNGVGTIEVTSKLTCRSSSSLPWSFGVGEEREKKPLLANLFHLDCSEAIDDIQTRHPGIFGPHGGYSRAISICSMGWTIGAFLGPILSGYLVETIGYYEMTGVIGKYQGEISRVSNG